MKRSLLLLGVLALTFAADGLAAPFLTPQEERGVGMAHSLAIAVLCYLWCRTNAWERGTLPPGRSAIWAALFPLLGLPIYFFRSRPRKQALVACGKFVAIIIGLVALDLSIAEGVRALRT